MRWWDQMPWSPFSECWVLSQLFHFFEIGHIPRNRSFIKSVRAQSFQVIFSKDFNFNCLIRLTGKTIHYQNMFDNFTVFFTVVFFLFFLKWYLIWRGFPGDSDGKSICLQCRRSGFNPWVWKIPWRRKWQPTPVFLPGKSHGRWSLMGYSPWGHKESDMTEWLPFTSLHMKRWDSHPIQKAHLCIKHWWCQRIHTTRSLALWE